MSAGGASASERLASTSVSASRTRVSISVGNSTRSTRPVASTQTFATTGCAAAATASPASFGPPISSCTRTTAGLASSPSQAWNWLPSSCA